LGFNITIPDSAINLYRQAAREAYTKSGGNEDAAKTMAMSALEKEYQQSSFNNRKELMLLPPEKVFPSIPTETMRSTFEREVKGILPDVDASQYKIMADTRTKGYVARVPMEDGTFKEVPVPTYIILDDLDLPAIDKETGEILRWRPQLSDFRKTLVDEAKELREVKKSLPDRQLQTGPMPRGIDR
jgi:hypothetical protein